MKTWDEVMLELNRQHQKAIKHFASIDANLIIHNKNLNKILNYLEFPYNSNKKINDNKR